MTETSPRAGVPADPRLLDADLRRWAGERIAAGGRKDALLGRVERLCLSTDGRSIEARVRGNRPLPYHVQVWIGEADAELASRCTCAGRTPSACKHAVAAVEALRFPRPTPPTRRRGGGGSGRGRGRGRILQAAPPTPGFVLLGARERALTREERLSLAREEELAARRQRSRQEKTTVALIDGPELPPSFRVTQTGSGATAVVTLRGPRAKLASCSCQDFETNELGTCLHVERVRRWYLRKPKRIPQDVLSVWRRPRTWIERVPDPRREIRVELPPQEQPPPQIQRYFDDEGWLRASADVREALTAAERVARRRGWTWDLDPQVARLADARPAETTPRVERAGAAWREVLSQLKLRLHPYQEHGVSFLARRGRALLADDMGLGKTVQAIAAALLLGRTAGVRKTLVVCPASLKLQWCREIEKACDAPATVVEGSRRSRLAVYGDWTEGFLILNYELVLRDLEAIREAGADLLVLDEAQRIKNWETQTARAVKRLDCRFVFVLTGTPLENRLLELHSLVEILHSQALGPRWRLMPYHAVTESDGRVIAYEGLDVLRGRLREFLLRRERREVLDELPDRTDNTFWTGMTLAQRRPYRRQVSALASLLSAGRPLRAQEVRVMLRALTAMRILCNAGAQFAWETHAERLADPAPPTQAELRALHSPKLEEFARVLEDLLDESDAKVVVFSQWERMLRLAHFAARTPLESRDLRADVFHGGLATRARADMLEAFRVDPEFRVLFSTDAGGLGLNLQEAASIVVNLEVPWNPAVLEQRIGRVHRLGQRKSVQVLHFVTRGALEARVRQLLESKRALFDGVLVDPTDRVVFDPSRQSSFVERVRAMIDDV